MDRLVPSSIVTTSGGGFFFNSTTWSYALELRQRHDTTNDTTRHD
jgi:hypothetical protein